MKRILGDLETIIPNDFLVECRNRGRIEKVEYESYDYINNRDLKKIAFVYLPYDYNEKKKYNVIYFVHGFTNNQKSIYDSNDILNILDNGANNKKINDFIFVSISFLPTMKNYSWNESILYLSTFYKEFEKYIMPFFETKYSTYTLGLSKRNLEESRNHRYFIGFSLGGIIAWWMIKNSINYINTFLSIAGYAWYFKYCCEDYFPLITINILEKTLKDKSYNVLEYVGTNDSFYKLINIQMDNLFSKKQFTDDKIKYYVLNGYGHDNKIVKFALYELFKNNLYQ